MKNKKELLKTAFIRKQFRPEVSGQFYEPTAPEYFHDILKKIILEDIKNTRKRREIIIRLLTSIALPEEMHYKVLLKDAFNKLAKRLQ